MRTNRILVVDDMAIYRESIAAALRREGFEVSCAADGREALKRARAQQPDLILLDVAMPEMDGISCLKALRKDPYLQNIAVIMLSAMSERDVAAEAAKLGVQVYLLKSQFSLDELLAQVHKHLGATHMPAGEKKTPVGATGSLPASAQAGGSTLADLGAPGPLAPPCFPTNTNG